MTLNQAIKKYKLISVDAATTAKRCKEFNVDQILYMHIAPHRVIFVVEDVLGTWLYTDEINRNNQRSKGIKRIKLSD